MFHSFSSIRHSDTSQLPADYSVDRVYQKSADPDDLDYEILRHLPRSLAVKIVDKWFHDPSTLTMSIYGPNFEYKTWWRSDFTDDLTNENLTNN